MYICNVKSHLLKDDSDKRKLSLIKKLMIMNKNPFAIRKSPVSIISAQALTIDDYVQRTLDDNDRVSFCATTNKK